MVAANGSKPKGAINAMIDRAVIANDGYRQTKRFVAQDLVYDMYVGRTILDLKQEGDKSGSSILGQS
jgi:hypothetical protein